MLEDSGLRGLEKVLAEFVESEKKMTLKDKPYNSFMYIDENGALRRRDETVVTCMAEDENGKSHCFELFSLRNVIEMDSEVVKEL